MRNISAIMLSQLKEEKLNLSNDLMTNTGEITRTENSNVIMFTADKNSMDKIKGLSDEEFEKHISSMDNDMKMFLRLARNH